MPSPPSCSLAHAAGTDLACVRRRHVITFYCRHPILLFFHSAAYSTRFCLEVFKTNPDLNNPLRTVYMDNIGPRWKGKGYSAYAQDNPMSKMVEQLQASLTQLEANAQLSGCSALLQADPELADSLDRACFGRRITTSEQNAHWFQLGLEEAFYMSHDLKCVTILAEGGNPMNGVELWENMKSKQEMFPVLYRAYSHLRSKNWVVRSGAQYGVDFVAYRHHPALVHSEYAVLVLPEGDGHASSPRLRVWSDLQCTLRVSGSVAKTLLVLSVKGSCESLPFPLCLKQPTIEERVITRWVPEQCRDNG